MPLERGSIENVETSVDFSNCYVTGTDATGALDLFEMRGGTARVSVLLIR